MTEEITITFKVNLKTEEPAELMRLLQFKSFEGVLLAGVADAVRDRLIGEKVQTQVTKIELKVPHSEKL